MHTTWFRISLDFPLWKNRLIKIHVIGRNLLLVLALCSHGEGWRIRAEAIEPSRDKKGEVTASFWKNLPTNHWTEIAGTQLISVAPEPRPPGVEGVTAVVDGYSGAAFDTKRQSLLVWGGGQQGYAGNEIYEFSVTKLRFSRLWGPSPLQAMKTTNGEEVYADGNPVSRHTYGGLAYAENSDAFVSISGSLFPNGAVSKAAWQFDLPTATWSGPIADANPSFGKVAEYDPVSGRIFTGAGRAIQEYDPIKKRFVASYPIGPISYVSTSTVIPKRRIMLILGGGSLASFNFDTKKFQVLPVSGETQVIKPLARGPYNFYYAGFAYVEDLDTLLAWDNNGVLFSINPNTWAIQKLAITGVPPAKPVNGMAGRMRYVPSKNLLVLVTHAKRNVYMVKLRAPLPLAAVSLAPTGQLVTVRGKNFTSVSAAAGFAKDGDLVEFAATTYHDDGAVWPQHNLTLRGVGGRAHMEGGAVAGKGIWVIQGNNVTVENIEFSNASVDDRNGAGIRHEGAGLRVRNCLFRDNENGILTNNSQVSEVIVENSEFSGNGDGSGQTHNMYIGQIKSFTLRGSYSHHARVGHNVKSRARTNFILYNRIMDETTGTASYAVDLPNGGISYLIGNQIQQGPLSENSGIVSFGAEKVLSDVNEIYLVNNTIVNDMSNGLFLYVVPGAREVKVINNVFAGPGKLPTWKTMSGNVHVDKAALKDASNYDYHLKSNAAAIGAGVDPGEANGYGLWPEFEYENGVLLRPRERSKTIDSGAYQFRSQGAPK